MSETGNSISDPAQRLRMLREEAEALPLQLLHLDWRTPVEEAARLMARLEAQIQNPTLSDDRVALARGLGSAGGMAVEGLRNQVIGELRQRKEELERQLAELET